ncbi:hypothetical protein SRIMM317S_00652 [Streptomyces rimosus subsp. rimosus]
MPDLSHLSPLPPKAATDDRHALRERIHGALTEALVNGTLAPGQEPRRRASPRISAPPSPRSGRHCSNSPRSGSSSTRGRTRYG